MTLRQKLPFLIPAVVVVAIAAVAMRWENGKAFYMWLLPGVALLFASLLGQIPRQVVMWGGAFGFALMGVNAYTSFQLAPERVWLAIVLMVCAVVVFAASFTLPKDEKPTA